MRRARDRRLFRRVAAGSAMVAGVTGIAANAFLASYFALAQPWQPGHGGPWEWLGPANDIVGSLSMAALVPVVAYLRRRMRDDRMLGVLSVGAVLASTAFAAAGPLLVAGAITLETQFVVAGVGLPVIFGWAWRTGRSARRATALPRRTARSGEWIGAAALVATALAGIGLAAAPNGSAAQDAMLGAAAIPGLPAYLAFPIWLVAVGRGLARAGAAGADEVSPAPAAPAGTAADRR